VKRRPLYIVAEEIGGLPGEPATGAREDRQAPSDSPYRT
jgi:hypothetical protein